MPRALNISESNRAIAQSLVIQGFSFRVVSEKTGLNQRTIQTWARRYGWRKLRDETKREVNQASVVTVGQSLARTSETLKETLAGTLSKHSQALAEVPARPNLQHLKQVGQAIEPLARASKLVFDWGDNVRIGLIDARLMEVACESESFEKDDPQGRDQGPHPE